MECRLHQRVLVGHRFPGGGRHVLAARLAHQQQAEGERLGEGGGEQLVERALGVAARLRVGVEHVAEILADQLERAVLHAVGAQLLQPVGDDRLHQPRGVGQVGGQRLRVGRGWWAGEAQRGDDRQEGCGVGALDQLGRLRVASVRVQRLGGHDPRLGDHLVPLQPRNVREVAAGPVRQRGEAGELALVVRALPLAGVSRLVARLQLDKGAGELTLPLERDVGAADAGVLILRQDGRRIARQDVRHQLSQQPLERGGECRLRAVRIGPPLLANALGVGDECVGCAHPPLLTQPRTPCHPRPFLLDAGAP